MGITEAESQLIDSYSCQRCEQIAGPSKCKYLIPAIMFKNLMHFYFDVSETGNYTCRQTKNRRGQPEVNEKEIFSRVHKTVTRVLFLTVS